MGHHLAEVAAITEQALRVGLLEIAEADLAGGNLGGDGQDRRTAALGVEQAVDQVQIARTAGAGADRQAPAGVGGGTGREGRGFFMTHATPADAITRAQAFGEAVERIARQAPDGIHTSGFEGGDEQIGNGFHSHDKDSRQGWERAKPLGRGLVVPSWSGEAGRKFALVLFPESGRSLQSFPPPAFLQCLASAMTKKILIWRHCPMPRDS